MNSVAPVWDGNETWLVLAGAGLLGAFPLVYSVFLPALYIGVFLMLAGLIFRGWPSSSASNPGAIVAGGTAPSAGAPAWPLLLKGRWSVHTSRGFMSKTLPLQVALSIG